MELKAQKRSVTGKGVQALRDNGVLPAVVYGAKEDSQSIEVDEKIFSQILKEAGESTVVDLVIDGDKKSVLIHDIDRHPVTNEPRHVDFYVVEKGQKVEVAVPLVFTGEAPAVKEFGVNVVKVLHEIQIEAEAINLPHELSVDISHLDTLESSIAVKDIPLPTGVTLVTEPGEAVVTLVMPEEEPEEPVEAPDMDAIGLSEEKGKKEEGDSPEGEKSEKTEEKS